MAIGPLINPAATLLWPPTGSRWLLCWCVGTAFGPRSWLDRFISTRGGALDFKIRLRWDRNTARSIGWGVGHESLVERSPDVRDSRWHCKICPDFLCPDRDGWFNRRPGQASLLGTMMISPVLPSSGQLGGWRCSRHVDHCSCHRALGDDASASFFQMGPVGNSRSLHSLSRDRRHCLRALLRQRPHERQP